MSQIDDGMTPICNCPATAQNEGWYHERSCPLYCAKPPEHTDPSTRASTALVEKLSEEVRGNAEPGEAAKGDGYSLWTGAPDWINKEALELKKWPEWDWYALADLLLRGCAAKHSVEQARKVGQFAKGAAEVASREAQARITALEASLKEAEGAMNGLLVLADHTASGVLENVPTDRTYSANLRRNASYLAAMVTRLRKPDPPPNPSQPQEPAETGERRFCAARTVLENYPGQAVKLACPTCHSSVGQPCKPAPAHPAAESPALAGGHGPAHELTLFRDDLIDGLTLCDTFADLREHLIQRRRERTGK